MNISIGIAELQRENAELQELLKDKARLDWLADVNQSIGIVILPRDIAERNVHDMRSAIDEAMLIHRHVANMCRFLREKEHD